MERRCALPSWRRRTEKRKNLDEVQEVPITPSAPLLAEKKQIQSQITSFFTKKNRINMQDFFSEFLSLKKKLGILPKTAK